MEPLRGTTISLSSTATILRTGIIHVSLYDGNEDVKEETTSVALLRGSYEM